MNNPAATAIRQGNINELKQIINNPNFDINLQYGSRRKTILQYAILKCDIRPLYIKVPINISRQIVLLLLKQNPDVTLRDANGNTALHSACSGQTPEFIDILIERGSNINAQNTLGNTPLHNAIKAIAPEAPGGLDTDAPDEVEIYKTVINKLIENHANPDIRNLQNRSPILELTHMAELATQTTERRMKREQLAIAKEIIDKIPKLEVAGHLGVREYLRSKDLQEPYNIRKKVASFFKKKGGFKKKKTRKRKLKNKKTKKSKNL